MSQQKSPTCRNKTGNALRQNNRRTATGQKTRHDIHLKTYDAYYPIQQKELSLNSQFR